MSKNGTSAPDFKNYTSSQLEKFSAIMEARNANNIHLAASLIINLSSEDDLKFDKYTADWDRFYEAKKAAQEQLEYDQREIDSAHQQVEVLQTERKEIIHQHKPKVVAALSKTKGHTNDHSATSEKKGISCTLI